MADGVSWWSAGLTWAWKNRVEVLGYLKSVREWFRSDPGRGILVIGSGGVGKSTLARLLSGDFDWLLDDPWDYRESYGVEEYALADDPKVEVVVPPGQVARRDATWATVEQGLATGAYRGVVYVTADGHHTLPRGSYKLHRLYQGNKANFLTAYLDERRADEVAVLDRLAAGLAGCPGRVWLLSVVTKEDLWWPDRQRVEAAYRSGPFTAAVGQIVSRRGSSGFRHEVVPASLVIGNFLSGDGEPLLRNVEGYDHRRQVESVRRLFEVLRALREWEAGP